jgi:hypothetical protein
MAILSGRNLMPEKENACGLNGRPCSPGGTWTPGKGPPGERLPANRMRIRRDGWMQESLSYDRREQSDDDEASSTPKQSKSKRRYVNAASVAAIESERSMPRWEGAASRASPVRCALA